MTAVRTELYIDGTLTASADSAGLSYSWNAASASAGTHTIVSKVYDAESNARTSSAVTITVVPPGPSPKQQNIKRHVSHARSGG